jgi:hypothetical protein
MTKYLIIDCTNGPGYSSPAVSILGDRQSAFDLYHQYVGVNVISNLELTETGFESNHHYTLFEDGEDNHGCHIIEVEEKQMWIIDGNFSNEIWQMEDTHYIEDALDGLNITCNKDDESEFWIEEDSHEACTAHAECQDSGTHYTIIQIK